MIISARPGAARMPLAPGCLRGFGQLFERDRIGVAEGKADAARQRSIAQPMRTDGLAAVLPRDRRGDELAMQQIGDGRHGTSRLPLAREHVARARIAAASAR